MTIAKQKLILRIGQNIKQWLIIQLDTDDFEQTLKLGQQCKNFGIFQHDAQVWNW